MPAKDFIATMAYIYQLALELNPSMKIVTEYDHYMSLCEMNYEGQGEGQGRELLRRYLERLMTETDPADFATSELQRDVFSRSLTKYRGWASQKMPALIGAAKEDAAWIKEQYRVPLEQTVLLIPEQGYSVKLAVMDAKQYGEIVLHDASRLQRTGLLHLSGKCGFLKYLDEPDDLYVRTIAQILEPYKAKHGLRWEDACTDIQKELYEPVILEIGTLLEAIYTGDDAPGRIQFLLNNFDIVSDALFVYPEIARSRTVFAAADFGGWGEGLEKKQIPSRLIETRYGSASVDFIFDEGLTLRVSVMRSSPNVSPLKVVMRLKYLTPVVRNWNK